MLITVVLHLGVVSVTTVKSSSKKKKNNAFFKNHFFALRTENKTGWIAAFLRDEKLCKLCGSRNPLCWVPNQLIEEQLNLCYVHKGGYLWAGGINRSKRINLNCDCRKVA